MLITTIKSYIEEHNLLPNGSKVIVGLSGGPDSVFLLHVLAQRLQEKNLKLVAAHLDHQWRENSAQDVLFCQNLAEKLGIEFVSAKRADIKFEFKKTGSKEEEGRLMRRAFLEAVMRAMKADMIALAHHADDQEETFFIRLIRGSSVAGLSGMRARGGDYVRPLLPVFKKDILAYLDEHTIPYLIDPSNEWPDFLRNRIRMSVIPALRECDERFDKNFLSTIAHLQDAQDTLAALTIAIFNDIATTSDGIVKIDVVKLLALNSYLRNRVILHWLISEHVHFSPAESFFAEIIRFLEQPGSKDHSMHTTWGLRKQKNLVWITKQ